MLVLVAAAASVPCRAPARRRDPRIQALAPTRSRLDIDEPAPIQQAGRRQIPGQPLPKPRWWRCSPTPLTARPRSSSASRTRCPPRAIIDALIATDLVDRSRSRGRVRAAPRAPIPCACTLPYVGPGESVLFVDRHHRDERDPRSSAGYRVRGRSRRVRPAHLAVSARSGCSAARSASESPPQHSRLVHGAARRCWCRRWYAVDGPSSRRARRPSLASAARPGDRGVEIFLIGDAEGGEVRVWTAAP